MYSPTLNYVDPEGLAPPQGLYCTSDATLVLILCYHRFIAAGKHIGTKDLGSSGGRVRNKEGSKKYAMQQLVENRVLEQLSPTRPVTDWPECCNCSFCVHLPNRHITPLLPPLAILFILFILSHQVPPGLIHSTRAPPVLFSLVIGGEGGEA